MLQQLCPPRGFPGGGGCCLPSPSTRVSDPCLERVSSKEVRLIPSGGIQQQLEHNWLSGQCTWAGPDGCNPAALGSFPLDVGGVSLHGTPLEMGRASNAGHSPSALQVPIVCTKEGSWTEEFKLCESLQGSCPPPPELNLVEYKCEQGHGIGEGR